jgi:hypothetical protein
MHGVALNRTLGMLLFLHSAAYCSICVSHVLTFRGVSCNGLPFVCVCVCVRARVCV